MNARLTSILFMLTVATLCNAQVAPYGTFSTTRNINGHSVETLKKKELDVRITHRFGDIAGDNGGYHTLFGLDQSTDIRIAGELGLTDNLMVGVGRAKGGGPFIRELFDGFVKYRLLWQDKNGPVSLTVVGSAVSSTMEASSDPGSPTNFDNFGHRVSYSTQALIAHKVNERISVQLSPTWVHRNYVAFDDENDLFAVGVAGRMKVTKVMAVAVEYFVTGGEREVSGITFQDPFSIGLEFDTGGHVFQLDLTNATGIGAYQFIPYTFSDWGEGQFRLGFTISRPFNL